MPKLEVEIHTDSQLPSDLLTPTLGSNYGLDGYPDMQYGMGVLEGVSDPDLMPAPALPNGLNKGAHMDVSAAMESPASPTSTGSRVWSRIPIASPKPRRASLNSKKPGG